MDCLKNKYNKNETFTFSKVPMTPKNDPSELLATPSFDFLAKLEHQRLFVISMYQASIDILYLIDERAKSFSGLF